MDQKPDPLASTAATGSADALKESAAETAKVENQAAHQIQSQYMSPTRRGEEAQPRTKMENDDISRLSAKKSPLSRPAPGPVQVAVFRFHDLPPPFCHSYSTIFYARMKSPV